MKSNEKIYIAGHRGLAGSAIYRKCVGLGYENIVTRSHAELDLTRQDAVDMFFDKERPAYVFLAAAKVGGILANSAYPAEFIYTNLAIQTHILHAAFRTGVQRLLFLGSSCIYPRECPQPMKEEHLLTGPLEATNQPYAVAKIAGIVQCEAYNRQYDTRFLAAMPTNLFGRNDSYDLTQSHVLPALIRKFHLAKLAANGEWNRIQRDEAMYGEVPEEMKISLAAISRAHGGNVLPSLRDLPYLHSAAAVTLWGSGSPRREFLHADDLADACVFLMNLEDERYTKLCMGGGRTSLPIINVGVGKDQSIQDLANQISKIVGFAGDVVWDETKPDGTLRKLLDTSLLCSVGWKPAIAMEEGIRRTYHSYLQGPCF